MTRQLQPQSLMVFDNAVMHQSQSLTGNMGVRISRRRLSMGRPARVRNADAAVKPALAFDQLFQDPDATDALGDLDLAGLVLNRHAGRVVAAVLEASQSIENIFRRPFRADVSDDAAHMRYPLNKF